jgi:hypothetical protein
VSPFSGNDRADGIAIYDVSEACSLHNQVEATHCLHIGPWTCDKKEPYVLTGATENSRNDYLLSAGINAHHNMSPPSKNENTTALKASE